MDIGREDKPFIAEPLEDPFRKDAPAPPPPPEPVREPEPVEGPAGT